MYIAGGACEPGCEVRSATAGIAMDRFRERDGTGRRWAACRVVLGLVQREGREANTWDL